MVLGYKVLSHHHWRNVNKVYFEGQLILLIWSNFMRMHFEQKICHFFAPILRGSEVKINRIWPYSHSIFTGSKDTFKSEAPRKNNIHIFLDTL